MRRLYTSSMSIQPLARASCAPLMRLAVLSNLLSLLVGGKGRKRDEVSGVYNLPSE